MQADFEPKGFAHGHSGIKAITALARVEELVMGGMTIRKAKAEVGVYGSEIRRAATEERWARLLAHSGQNRIDRNRFRPTSQRELEILVDFMTKGDTENDFAIPRPRRGGWGSPLGKYNAPTLQRAIKSNAVR